MGAGGGCSLNIWPSARWRRFPRSHLCPSGRRRGWLAFPQPVLRTLGGDVGRPHQPCKRALWQSPTVLEIPRFAISFSCHHFPSELKSEALPLPVWSVQTCEKEELWPKRSFQSAGEVAREPGTISKANELQEAKKHVVLSHGEFEGCACLIGSSFSTVFFPHSKGSFTCLLTTCCHVPPEIPFQKGSFSRGSAREPIPKCFSPMRICRVGK